MAILYENNGDAPYHTGTQYELSPGDSFRGRLDSDDDDDLVRIDLIAGQRYEFRLDGYGDDALTDPNPALFDAETNLVARNYGGSGPNAVFRFTAPATGTYYIAISSSYDTSGDYELSVTEIERSVGDLGPIDGLANYLVDASRTDGERRSFEIGEDGALSVDITALNAEGQQLARWALSAWADVTGIRFEFVSEDAGITFDDEIFPEGEAQAFATSITEGTRIISATVNVAADWLDDYGAGVNSYTFSSYIHEIGHALGLGHPGDYDGEDTTYTDDALFSNDSYQTSVMSYFDQEENTDIDADYALPITPMIADIIAIQQLYGTSENNPGDTVYGDGSNVQGYLGEFFANWTTGDRVTLTLYDTGGMDTINLSAETAYQRIDLRPEGISDVKGLTGNLIIARDTIIERAIGGEGQDEIIGNSADNRLEGRGGDDTLTGGSGADILNGGAGQDTASYADSESRVDVRLSGTVVQHGAAEGDTLISIENLTGSNYNDTLAGDSQNNRLSGGAGSDLLWGSGGNDTLLPGAGADRLVGSTGEDTVSYDDSDAAVVVNLETSELNGGHADGDTFAATVEVATAEQEGVMLPDVEHITGSAFDDTLTGDLRANTLTGGAGADRLSGGPGIDTASWANSASGVTVRLHNNQATGGDATGDIFAGTVTVEYLTNPDINGLTETESELLPDIENITGSAHNDVLAGDFRDNIIRGGAGNDILYGGPGGGDGTGADSNHDTLAGGPGDDRIYGGRGMDTLAGGPGDDSLFGGPGADTLVFASDNGQDTIIDFDPDEDRIDLTDFNLGNNYRPAMTIGDDGVTLDLSDIGGGNVLLAELTTAPESDVFIL